MHLLYRLRMPAGWYRSRRTRCRAGDRATGRLKPQSGAGQGLLILFTHLHAKLIYNRL